MTALALAGCHGGTFRLEGPLASSRPMPVTGELGFTAAACEPGTPAKGLAGDRESSATVGGMHVIASAPHRDVTTLKLFGENALGDYEAMLTELGDAASAARAASLRGKLQASADAEGVVSDAETAVADADALVRGLGAVLALPSSTTERIAFTFVGRSGERTVLGSCWTTTTARTFGTFDDPRFSLSCRMATSADGASRELRVKGTGSWANYAFEGELANMRADAKERFAFASQNVSIMGAGGIRGFDLAGPNGQVAALSFWQTRKPGTRDEFDPAAWVLPTTSPGLADALTATLALAWLYPWPTGCNTQQARDASPDAGH